MKNTQCFMEREAFGVSTLHFTDTASSFNSYFVPGMDVICPGSPGHGSKFIKNTAGEKLVKSLLEIALLSFSLS